MFIATIHVKNKINACASFSCTCIEWLCKDSPENYIGCLGDTGWMAWALDEEGTATKYSFELSEF